jgi:Uri superfamily endonuclease
VTVDPSFDEAEKFYCAAIPVYAFRKISRHIVQGHTRWHCNYQSTMSAAEYLYLAERMESAMRTKK